MSTEENTVDMAEWLVRNELNRSIQEIEMIAHIYRKLGHKTKSEQLFKLAEKLRKQAA